MTAVTVVITSVCLCSPATAQVPRGFGAVAENESLILHINSDTAEIAVTDKRSGDTWYSNPPDRDKVEKIARGDGKLALGAQFRLTYFEPGDVVRTVDSFVSSVAHNQFEIEPIKNGVRVRYIVGKQWADRDFLPLFMSKDTFENEVLAKIETAVRGGPSKLHLARPGEVDRRAYDCRAQPQVAGHHWWDRDHGR